MDKKDAKAGCQTVSPLNVSIAGRPTVFNIQALKGATVWRGEACCGTVENLKFLAIPK